MWFGVAPRMDTKRKRKKGMCLKEIGLRAQNLITILSSIVNMIGGTYMITYKAHKETLTLIMNKTFVWP